MTDIFKDLIGCTILKAYASGSNLVLSTTQFFDDETNQTLSIEPAWRIRQNNQLFAGSDELQYAEESSGELAIFENKIKQLEGQTIEAIILGDDCQDLSVRLQNHLKVESFACHHDEYAWQYSNAQGQKRYWATANIIDEQDFD